MAKSAVLMEYKKIIRKSTVNADSMFLPQNPNQFAETGKGVVLPDLAYMMEESNTGTAGDYHLFTEGHVSAWEGAGR